MAVPRTLVRVPGAAASRARRQRPPLMLVVPALVAAGVALLPLAYLVVRSLDGGLGEFVETLWRERTLRLTLRSLGLAVTVTIACLVIGITLAWLTTRARLPGRGGWAVVVALPLAVPSYVAAYTWLAAFPTIPPFVGSVLVLTLCCYPYVLLPVAAMLLRSDPALEEVARSLGRGRVATFFAVTLRQVRPAAAVGALLVALYVLSDFGAVAILRYDVFTRVIYTSYRSSFDGTAAAALGLVLVAITSAIVWAEGRSRGRASQARIGSGAPRRLRTVALGRSGTAAGLGFAIVVAGLALAFPLGSLTYWLVQGGAAELDLAALGGAAVSTIAVSALGALLTTVLAIPVGVLAARYRMRHVRAIEQASYAGHALPGIVVALSLVFFGVRYAYPIYQRTPLLVLAYAVLFLPAAVGAVRASVAQSPPMLEEVARSLGRSPGRVLRDVTLPLAGPGVAAGAALVFLTCMKELPATLLLRPTGLETLATELWAETEVAAYAAAAPYATLLVLLAALPTLLLGHRRRSVTLDVHGGGA
ncbi:MAG TPA: iron ABC transporter permease [Jiangellaceae bacterium]|nr:iron ABC transporter permease [Jiangellaceae bacterium]